MAVNAPTAAPGHPHRHPPATSSGSSCASCATGCAARRWRIVLFVLGVLFGLWFAADRLRPLRAARLAGDNADARRGRWRARRRADGARLDVPAAGVLRRRRDPRPGPLRAAAAAPPHARRPACSPPRWSASRRSPPSSPPPGCVLTAAAARRIGAALVQAVGVVAGLLLCVAASRAVTSAFATHAALAPDPRPGRLLLAVVAACIGPLQFGSPARSSEATGPGSCGLAAIVGWTPFGAPYIAGFDVAAGRLGPRRSSCYRAGHARRCCCRWWSPTLESAMLGHGQRAPRARSTGRGAARRAVAQLFPRRLRWAPAQPVRRTRRPRGALLVAGRPPPRQPDHDRGRRRLRADLGQLRRPASRRRAAPATRAVAVALSMVFVGALASVTLANQFGFDGSAYAAN